MNAHTRLPLAAAVAGLALACTTTPEAPPPPDDPEVTAPDDSDVKIADAPAVLERMVRDAMAGAHRAEGAADRDRYRNPAETLVFMGLDPKMHVVEIWPGAGWYTDILAPVVEGKGRLTVGISDPDGPEDAYPTRIARSFLERLEGNPEVYGDVDVTVFAPPDRMELGEPGSVDMILVVRMMHNLVRREVTEPVLEAFYEALKPGGVLGVIAHRAPPVDDVEGFDPMAAAQTGYLPEAYVIGLAEAAGFVLDSRSEVNANPEDTADHPNGVWSLPPTLRGGDEDRERFVGIGESDRMTLRFVKPVP